MLIKNGWGKILTVIVLGVALSFKASAQEKQEHHHAGHAVATHAQAPSQSHSQVAPSTHAQASKPAEAHHEQPEHHGHHGAGGFHYYAHQPSTSTVPLTDHPFHHHHNNVWHPGYNYYGNGYHFYPYVNYAPNGELSAGYTPVQYNGETYYNDNGTYYQDEGNAAGYTAVEPPIGAAIDNVPSGSAEARINGVHYYIFNGIYYRRVGQSYMIVQAPVL